MSASENQIGTDRRPFVAFLAASGAAWFGNTITLIVVPWLVYQMTGSAAYTGLVGFAAALPLVISGVFAGVLIDRVGHTRVAIHAEIFSGLFLVLIPALGLLEMLSVWAVMGLVFVSNLFSAAGMTARRSLIPDVSASGGVSLERSNSLEQMVSRAAMLAGPPLAGVLMAIVAPEIVILLTVVLVWASALAAYVGIPNYSSTSQVEKASTSYLSELFAGLRFIWQDRLIRALVIILALVNLMESPLSVLAPIYADRILRGSVDLGLMFVALGGGLMLGVAGFALYGDRFPRRVTFIVGFLGMGATYWVLATLPGLYLTLSVLFVLGLLAGPLNPLLSTVTQERVPAEMRGRVFGLMGAFALSMMPIGRLGGGLLIEWLGLGGTLLIQALGFALCSAIILTYPALRMLNNPHQRDPQLSPARMPPEVDTGVR